MDETQKKAAAEAEAKAAADAAAASAAEAKEKSKETGGIDYEAELKKEQELRAKKETELGKAQHTIVELKKKKDEGTPDIDALIESKIAGVRDEATKAIEAAKAELAGDAVEDEIARMTSDPKAQDLIRHHYEHSVVKSGVARQQVRDDVRKAFVLAHSPVVEKFASEAAHAAGARKATSGGYAGGQQVDRDELTADEEAQVAQIVRMTGQTAEAARKKLLANKQQS